MVTTIQIDEELKEKLDHLKVHHRETYNELLARIIFSMNSKKQENLNNENLTETLEVLSDTAAMREIAEALEAYDQRKGKSLKQLRKELGT